MTDSEIDGVSLRGLPWPYEAMLAICSDLDETPDAQVYLTTSRFLNTSKRTGFGNGVGLEVGNSIYFYMNEPDFAYWNATDAARSAIRNLIRSGHIDCIHSFGDTATSRAQTQETLEHLHAHDCRLRVWIDHAVAVTNLGADIMRGCGDLVGSPAYHADLTLDYGVEYVWRGRVSSMHGQDAPHALSRIWCSEDPLRSSVTLGKEAAKVIAARLGSAKYAMHGSNRLLSDVVLRDAHRTTEFLRINPHPHGVSVGDNARGLAQVLSDRFMDNLVKRQAKAIVYTHLGKQIDPRHGFPAASRLALEKLADRMRAKQVLVTTTERLLDHARLRERLTWTVQDVHGVKEITVASGCKASCEGLSFLVPANADCRILHNGAPLKLERADLPDSAKAVVSVPWKRLAYEN